MVELNDVWDSIWMLVVAFCLGLLGGLGAAFLEFRKGWPADAEATATGRKRKPIWYAVSCVVLGGIAAVASLYFIAPTETIPDPTNPDETVTSYSVLKLVSLSLLVGSAGTAVLQSMHGRISAQLAAQRESQAKEVVKATGVQGVEEVATQASSAAGVGIEDSPAAAKIQTALQQSTALNHGEAERLLADLAADASKRVADSLEPQVKGAQERIAAVAASGGEPG